MLDLFYNPTIMTHHHYQHYINPNISKGDEDVDVPIYQKIQWWEGRKKERKKSRVRSLLKKGPMFQMERHENTIWRV